MADEGSKPRVLIVSNLFPPHVVGGAEVVAHRQAKALAERGHAVAIFAGCFAADGREPGSLSREDDGPLRVYRVALISLELDENFFRPEFARRLRSVMEAHRPDVVHFHNPIGLGVNLIPVARAFGARVVVTLHDHWGFCYKNTLLLENERVCVAHEDCGLCHPAVVVDGTTSLPMRLRRDYVAWCVGQADTLLAPSAYLANKYNESNTIARQIEVLSNGIELSAIPSPDERGEGPVQFSCFSWLGRHKGIHILLDAAERLATIPELGGRWSLKIAGHGALQSEIESRIASGCFGGCVEYLGQLDHAGVIATLARTDVTLLASIWPENEPVSQLEGIASGTAQLVSRIGGNIELVDDEKSGLSFAPGSADDLCRAMIRFVSDPEFTRRCGAYNAGRRDLFSDSRTMDRLVEIYDRPDGSVRNEEFIVLCAGRPAEEGLDLMTRRFHLVEPAGRRVRFIWHGWADVSLWSKARLLWIWGDLEEGDQVIVSQAMRWGLSLLARKTSRFAAVSGLEQNLGVYGTLLDAIGLIAAFAESPDLARPLDPARQDPARLLDSVARREVFHYPLKSIP